jgi:hypothetical protein
MPENTAGVEAKSRRVAISGIADFLDIGFSLADKLFDVCIVREAQLEVNQKERMYYSGIEVASSSLIGNSPSDRWSFPCSSCPRLRSFFSAK